MVAIKVDRDRKVALRIGRTTRRHNLPVDQAHFKKHLTAHVLGRAVSLAQLRERVADIGLRHRGPRQECNAEHDFFSGREEAHFSPYSKSERELDKKTKRQENDGMDPTERARFLFVQPRIDPTAYVAAQAVVIGDVRLAAHSSVWPTSVLRGDINFIEIGEGSNIQDGSIVHLADDLPVRVGKLVTVGHRAILHACTVEDECLIGMGATILDGAVIGRGSIIGAHALVTRDTRIPPGSLVMGMPAKVVRALSPEEIAEIRTWADHYIALAPLHKMHFEKSAPGDQLF